MPWHAHTSHILADLFETVVVAMLANPTMQGNVLLQGPTGWSIRAPLAHHPPTAAHDESHPKADHIGTCCHTPLLECCGLPVLAVVLTPPLLSQA